MLLGSKWQPGLGKTDGSLETAFTGPTGANLSRSRQQRAAEVDAIAVLTEVGVVSGEEKPERRTFRILIPN